MKSLTADPPHGWQYIQPEAGMKKPFGGSFRRVCDQVLSLRRANKYLAQKHNWSLDRTGIEFDVEQQNVARMQAHGWLDFLVTEAQVSPPSVIYDSSKKNPFANAVGGIKRVAAGVGVLIDWLGSAGKPVEQKLAESRAAICVDCPKNDGGDWKSYFTGPVANKIKTQLEMKHDLALKTSLDDKLTVCSGCDCPLQLKVHVPLSYILEHTDATTKQRLDPRCWILHEKT